MFMLSVRFMSSYMRHCDTFMFSPKTEAAFSRHSPSPMISARRFRMCIFVFLCFSRSIFSSFFAHSNSAFFRRASWTWIFFSSLNKRKRTMKNDERNTHSALSVCVCATMQAPSTRYAPVFNLLNCLATLSIASTLRSDAIKMILLLRAIVISLVCQTRPSQRAAYGKYIPCRV